MPKLRPQNSLNDMKIPGGGGAGAAPPEDESELSPEQELRATEARAKARARAAAAAETQRQQEAVATRTVEQPTVGAKIGGLEAAIAAAAAEVDAAKAEMATAFNTKNQAAMEAASNKISAAGTRQHELEADLKTLRMDQPSIEAAERQRAQSPAQPAAGNPARPPWSQQVDVETAIAGLKGLMPEEADWLRSHPYALLDPTNQKRLSIAFQDSQERGIERGTEAYFAFFEDRLGYGRREEVTASPPAVRPSRHQLRPAEEYDADGYDPAPAPAPQRASSGGRQPAQSPQGQVRLTEEMRHAARIAGVDEYTYALGVKRLQDAKRQGMYGMSEQK